MSKGFFIAFEGGEGSGKSTQAQLLASALQSQHADVVYTHEPGGSVVCAEIRKVILSHPAAEPVTPRAELLLFLADRAQHVAAVIAPVIERGGVVICDRFSGSTGAYQIGARQLPNPEFIMAMDEYARNGITPDLVIYLDVDPEVGLFRRMHDTTKALNRLDVETLEFHRRVRAYFQEHASQHSSWVQIDGNQTIEQNTVRIKEIVNTKLSSWRSESKK